MQEPVIDERPRSISEHREPSMSERERLANVATIRAIPLEEFSPDAEIAEAMRAFLVVLAAAAYDVDAYRSGPAQEWRIWVRPADPTHEGRYTPSEWTAYVRREWPYFRDWFGAEDIPGTR